MTDIRMPDGTVIRGVPDGVGRDDFSAHLIEKYGQEKYDSMTSGAQREPEPAPSFVDVPVDNEDALSDASLNAYRRNKTIQNEDGTSSSIRSMSVEDERLNAGKPTLIPSIWGGKELDPVEATDRAVESGTKWPAYDSNDQATAASKRISSGLAERAEEDESQRKVRDENNLYMANRTPFGMQGLKAKSKRERVIEMGKKIVDFGKNGIRSPEEYYMTEEEIDFIMFDKFAHDQKMLQENEEKAIASGILPKEPDERSNFEKSKWQHLKVKFMQLITGEDFHRFGELQDASLETRDKQYEAVGMLYLERAAETWEQLKPVQKEILDDSAEKLGLTGEQYYKMTATMIDQAVEFEHATEEGLRQYDEDMNRFRPKKEFGKDPFEYMALLATDNMSTIGYMAFSFALKSPAVLPVLMGTEVYQRKFTEDRRAGKSIGEATLNSTVYTALELALEGLPVWRILKLVKAGNKTGARKLLDAAVAEGSQEMVVEGLQMGWDFGMYDEKVSAAEALSRLRDSGLLGGLFGTALIAPSAISGDHAMNMLNEDIHKAKGKLQSVANRVLDPAGKGTNVGKAEVQVAVEEYAKTVNVKRKLIKERIEEAAEKKKAKVEKKETKRKAKRTPAEVKREDTQKKAAESDQSVDKLTPEIETEAGVIESIKAHEEVSASDAQGLLDKGLAKVTKRGTLVLLPAGNRRLTAVRKAQEGVKAKDRKEIVKPVVKPVVKAPTLAPGAINPIVKPIVKPVVKTEQESVEKAKVEKAEAVEFEAAEESEAEIVEQNMDEGYEQALGEQKDVEPEVAKNLARLDEKSTSGKAGTKLGAVLRGAEKKLREQADKAKSEMDMDFWTKPNQGTLFDVGGAMAKGTVEYAKLVKVGALKLATHGAKYSAWAADMIGEFGENIRPVLTRLYNDAKRNVKNVMKWSHERYGKGPRKGELKHGPKKYAKPGAIAGLRRVLEKLAGEGKGARMWYEKSGAAIEKATGNAEEARLLSGLLAIYSTGTGVGPNLTNALKMWSIYQSGKVPKAGAGTMAGRFSRQDGEAIRWMKGQTDDEFVSLAGPKVFAFFTNLMREVDPKTYEYGQGVTIDIWMMRAFGYDVQAPTDSQNAFAAVELKALAEKLGWEKQQVQAAIWVSIKARWGIITDRAQRRAVREKLAAMSPGKRGETFDVLGATRKEQVENEKKIIMIYRDEAMKASIGELTASINRSKKDFADFLESQYATVSWESDPSTSLGLVFNSMPIEDKILLQYEISQVLTNPETGREYLAEWLGLLGADQFQGPGAWDGAVGAVTQNQVLAPLQHKRSEAKHLVKTIQPQSASALDGYAAILGILLKQDAVAWHRPFYGNAKKRANGISIIMQVDMDAGKLRRAVTKLYSAIVAESVEQGFGEGTGLEWAPIVLNGEIRVLNFQDVGNRQFHKIIRAAAKKAGVGGAMEVFQTDGNLIMNDWVENPNGESYEQAISSNENKRVGKALERAKRELAGRIDSVYEKYAEKYAAGRRAEITVTRLGEGQKAPKLKKGRMRFRHFGQKVVGALKVEFFGTGIKGAEKSRGSMQVISAYPDKGFQKEVGLGNVEYVIDVAKEDLYDANNDPLGFRAKSTVPTGTQGGKPIGGRLDFNKFERLIKGAGFVGYYTPKADGNLKGQARFFHDITVGADSLSATLMVPSKPTIQIVENEMDQLEVRDTDGKISYIDDPDEAIRKARSIYGEVIVEIVDDSGNVIVTDHPIPVKRTLKLRLKEADPLSDIYVALGEFMAEFNEETAPNPLGEKARALDQAVADDERIFENGSAISLGRAGGTIWIDSIRSFDPGTGQGNSALKLLIGLADKHGVQMQLYASPFGEVGLDEQALIRWYEKNGFMRTTPSSTTLSREPQNVTGTFVGYQRPKISFWGISMEEARDVTDGFMEALGIDNVVILESVEDLIEIAPELESQVSKFPTSIAGVFHNSPTLGPTIFIVARNIDNITGDGGLMQVLLHETVGHFGLQALLGWKKYNQTMDAIIKALPDNVEMRRRTGKISGGLQSRRLAAEELFAYMVQDELLGKNLSKIQKGFIQRVIAEIKLLFVRLGWKKLTHKDMLNLMRQSLRFVNNNSIETLKKRSAAVSTRRVDAIMAENLVSPAATMSLKEEDPLLKSFDEKTGGERSGVLETLAEWRNRMRNGVIQRLEQTLIDQFSGIRHMEKELGIEKGGYMSVRLSAGVDVIIRSALDNAVPTWHVEEDGSASVKMDDTVKGLTDILSRLSSALLLHNFQRFLVANRSRRLIKEGKEKLVNREEIAAVLKDVRKQGQYKLFVEVQKELDTYKSKILDFAQEAGLIDPVSRVLWEKHDHVPFYRVLAKSDKNGAFAKLGSVGKVIHYQKGSTAKLKPVLENIFDNISMLIEASVNNRAATDVINQFKESGVVTKVPRMEISTALIPMDQVKKMLKDSGVPLDSVGEDLLTGVQKLMSLEQTSEEGNVVSVQVRGKKEFWYVHDEGVMGGMESVGANNYGWVMKILRFPKRMITSIITRFPGFVFANWFRDMMHSAILVRYGYHAPWDSLAGWAEAIWESETFKEMMAGGGMFDSGYINTSDPKTTMTAMKKRLMSEGRGNILDTPWKLARLYLRITNGAENAARIAIFKKTLRATGSRKQALYESRDIMDFSVRGSSPILQFFIETVPFLGARIQGLARTGRGFTGNPMLVGARGLTVVLATWALYLLNRDRDEYKALLDYDKHMYYHFFDVFEPGDHYRLPKPFEVGAIFSTIPEIGMAYLLSQEQDKGETAADALLWVLMEQFNLTPAVQFVAPAFELAINKNLFTEAPIENYWETQLDASRRYNDRTNKTIIWLAKNMPDSAPDFMRSPKQLEFLLKRYFATAADYALGISDRVFFAEGRPTPRMDEQFPVASRFVREPFPKFDKYQGAMYDVLDRAETIWQTMLDLKKDKTPDSRAESRKIKENRRALLYARKKMTPIYKRIQLLNKKAIRIHANTRMTPDEKRERLDRIIEQKRNLAERIYKYRPGGEGNPYDDKGNRFDGEDEGAIWQWLNEKTKREQVDALIGANLPHAATLINDVTIGLTKLKDVA